jgi:hypothetical protein
MSSLCKLLYLSLILLLAPIISYCQSDSVWCSHLNDFIKIVSTDVLDSSLVGQYRDCSHAISKYYLDSTTTIYFFEHKVTVEQLSHRNNSPYTLIRLVEEMYKRIHHCLDSWRMERIENMDNPITKYCDYLLTNGEDETTIRIGIDKLKSGYYLNIMIY